MSTEMTGDSVIMKDNNKYTPCDYHNCITISLFKSVLMRSACFTFQKALNAVSDRLKNSSIHLSHRQVISVTTRRRIRKERSGVNKMFSQFYHGVCEEEDGDQVFLLCIG